MEDRLIQKAKEIIENVSYISLATTNENGDPWNTPLIAIHNKEYNFYWRSAKDANHSKNIETNEKVFFIIYYTEYSEWDARQAVYVQAKAVELSDESEISNVLPLLDKKSGASFGTTNQYLKDSPRRVYRAIPDKIWINVD
jgi:general stress protein 26